jgi:hypothetical protein
MILVESSRPRPAVAERAAVGLARVVGYHGEMIDQSALRRRFQFSLSSLFCVTLLVAVWACGMRVIGGFYEPMIGWLFFTAYAVIGIWMFIRAAVRHQQRTTDR